MLEAAATITTQLSDSLPDGLTLEGRDLAHFYTINLSSGQCLCAGSIYKTKNINALKLKGKNPCRSVISIIKDDYQQLRESFPFADRLIVEVFSVDQYLKALAAGIKYPAFSIWDVAGLDAALTYTFNQVVTSDFLEKNREDFAKVHSLGVAIMTYGGGDNEQYFTETLGSPTSLYYSDLWSPRNSKRQ